MLTQEQARSLVVARLGGPRLYPDGEPLEFVVLDEHTIEKPWGWVFFYSSKRYHETGEIRYALAGNAPFIVNMHTGELRSTGTAQPIAYYIDQYERTLDPTR
jgi:hypothetical protein